MQSKLLDPIFITNPPHETDCLFTERKMNAVESKSILLPWRRVSCDNPSRDVTWDETIFYWIWIEMSCRIKFRCNNSRAISHFIQQESVNIRIWFNWTDRNTQAVGNVIRIVELYLPMTLRMMSQLKAICLGIKCFING